MEKRILNVGCGNQLYGTDRVDIVKTSATTKVCDIEKRLPYKDNTFDEVYSQYVFEHMKNPHALILEMKRVCKKGGVIRIITDNAGYILTHIKFGKLYYHGDQSDRDIHGAAFNNKDRHYALYTPEHLRNFFENAEIKIVKIRLLFWKDVKSKKSRLMHSILKFFLGERFAQPSVEIIGIKV